MKRTTLLVSFTLALVLFSGCMLGGSESNLERRLLKLMKNKYDVEFTIVEDSYEEYSLTNILVATLSPADNPDIQCTGSINTIGLFEDDYSTALLQDQLKDYYSVLCEYDFVRDYEIVVEGHSTRDNLNNLSFEEYLARREFYVYLNIQFYDGKTDDEYADDIYTILSGIDSFDGTVYMVNVCLDDNIYIFIENLYPINASQGQGLDYYTHDLLLHEIHTNRQNSIFRNSIRETTDG